jgi:hypothetical protein
MNLQVAALYSIGNQEQQLTESSQITQLDSWFIRPLLMQTFGSFSSLRGQVNRLLGKGIRNPEGASLLHRADLDDLPLTGVLSRMAAALRLIIMRRLDARQDN